MWPALARILSDITETEAQSVLHSYDMVVQEKHQSITALNEELVFMEKALSKTRRGRTASQRKDAFVNAIKHLYI